MAKYIPLDALEAEIEKCYNECLKRAKITDFDYWNAKAEAYRNVLVILNDALEVKEVDLNKEIKDYFDNQPIITRSKGIDYQFIPSVEAIAKHFFELGLKAQKG